MRTGLVLGLLIGLGLLGTMAVNLTETPKQEVGYYDDVVTAKGPVVNVLAYGATGDGVTDDSAAIQAAAIAAATAGSTLFFPAGVYRAPDKLVDNLHIRIDGDGPGRSIIDVNAYTGSVFVVDDNSEIRDLEIRGDGYSYGAVAIDEGTYAYLCRLTNLRFRDIGTCVDFENCWGSSFRDIFAIQVGKGLELSKANNCSLDEIYVNGHYDAAIRIQDTRNVGARHLIVENGAAASASRIILQGVECGTIDGVYLEGTLGTGAYDLYLGSFSGLQCREIVVKNVYHNTGGLSGTGVSPIYVSGTYGLTLEGWYWYSPGVGYFPTYINIAVGNYVTLKGWQLAVTSPGVSLSNDNTLVTVVGPLENFTSEFLSVADASGEYARIVATEDGCLTLNNGSDQVSLTMHSNAGDNVTWIFPTEPNEGVVMSDRSGSLRVDPNNRFSNLTVGYDCAYTPDGWWKMDDDAASTDVTDSSGNSYTATSAASNTEDMTVTGIVGAALTFDGSTDYASVGASTFSDTSGTVTFWIKLSADQTGYVLTSADTASTTRLIGVYYSTTGKHMRYIQNNNGTADILIGSSALATDTWYHCAVTSDGSTIRMYIDGVEETLSVGGGANNGDWFGDTAARDNVVIGALVTTSMTYPFAGAIDDVRVYSETLTHDQISYLWRARTETFDGTLTVNGGTGISGTLVLDDGSTEKITLTFTGGILSARTVEATTSTPTLDWTD